MNVSRVVGVRLGGDAEPRAQEAGDNLRTRLFQAIGVVAKAHTEIARKTVRRARRTSCPSTV